MMNDWVGVVEMLIAGAVILGFVYAVLSIFHDDGGGYA